MKEKRCSECRDGEHDNYDDNVELCKVYDNGKFLKKLLLCGAHQHCFLEDGYELR